VGHLRADFDGDVAIVTGAASGIGRAILAALCRAGARVHGLDVAAPGPEATEDDFRTAPVHHAVDLCDAEAVERVIAEIARAESRIDLLVNNAGIARDRALWKLADEEWQAVLDVNLTGAFRVLRAVASHMRASGRGRIVQVASINGLRGKFGQAAYSASKAGLIGLTRTAARELGPRGITVNAVAPGMIETAMTRTLPAEIRERARDESALGRLGRPEDVAACVLFLLSEAAAHVTGTVLVVDGGQTT